MVDCYTPARNGLLGTQYILFPKPLHLSLLPRTYNRTVAEPKSDRSQKNHMKISN